MEPVRVRPEPLEEPCTRQAQQRVHGGDAERAERLAHLGIDREAGEGDVHRRRARVPGVLEDVRGGSGLRHRVGVEAREGDHHGRGEAGLPQRCPDRLGPAGRRGVQALEPGGAQPEDAGLLRGRLHVRREPPEQAGQPVAVPGLLRRRDGTGPERRVQRQRGGVPHPGEHAGAAGLFVDPHDRTVRPVVLDHGGRDAAPPGMALEQDLQRERGEANAGHPVHGRPPRRSRA
jgi:hypothetical protein